MTWSVYVHKPKTNYKASKSVKIIASLPHICEKFVIRVLLQKTKDKYNPGQKLRWNLLKVSDPSTAKNILKNSMQVIDSHILNLW